MEHQSSLTSTPRINLSSKLQAFYNLALKHYPSKKEVERSDDEQEFFTSGGANYRHAIELTTIMALRAANEKQNTAQ
jgi:hypothetical protein